MVRLRQSEISAVLGFLRRLYAVSDREALIAFVLSDLSRVVGADATSFNEVDPIRQVTRTWMNPADLQGPAEERLWTQLCREHPYVQYRVRTGRLDPVRLSDLAAPSRMSRTALWNELLLPKGVEQQLLAGFPGLRGRVDGMGLYRHRRDFTERERSVLALLHAHLVQAHRNADTTTALRRDLELLERGCEVLDAGIMVLEPDGIIRFATRRGFARLRAYFPGWSGHAGRLPGRVAGWLARETAALAAARDLPPPRKPLVVVGERGRLVLRVVSEPMRHLLILEEQPAGGLESAVLARLGLSRREAEVLGCVAQGKTNPEIGALLHLSPRTVQTYLERIFQKLDVDSRSAAVGTALRAAKAV
jgi:DNA-binding CsgD family transcriptional regulator